MGKTGGGVGTNQYQVRGRCVGGVSGPPPAAARLAAMHSAPPARGREAEIEDEDEEYEDGPEDHTGHSMDFQPADPSVGIMGNSWYCEDCEVDASDWVEEASADASTAYRAGMIEGARY
ncbi:MAG: hypothetical protein ACRD0J_00160 [Acidimicrobiales bacterium]